MTDPYADIATPDTAAGNDPYAGFATPLSEGGGQASSGVRRGRVKFGAKTVEFDYPDGASDDDVRRLAKVAGTKAGVKGVDTSRSQVVDAGKKFPRSIGESLGMGVRGVAGGLVSPLDMLAGPVNAGINLVSGSRLSTTPFGDFADHLSDKAGLAKPETGLELAGDAINRGAAGAIAPVGIATSLSRFSPGVRILAEKPISQLVSGGTGSLAAQGVAAAGGGPIAQMAAGVVGGAAGFAPSATIANRFARSAETTPRIAPILARTMKAQGDDTATLSGLLTGAQKRGVPLALMDTGDEMRGLASSLGRKPGASRTLIRDAVIPRQEAQLDRVSGAVRRDLGDTANVSTQSESLIKGAQAKAKPLYDKAYAAPPISSHELDKLLSTPAGKGAISRAYTIAANEGRDPATIGLAKDAAGNIVMLPPKASGSILDASGKPMLPASGEAATAPAYPTQTLDYVKRGLDDIIESHRDSTTGRLKLDENLRAIQGVKASLVKEVDRLNPDYANARAAYAGPASMAGALRKGAKFANKDAETISLETRDLTPGEADQYKLGVRSAMIKAMEARVDGADKVKALVGSPKKRAVLQQLFGGKADFDNFMATLADEQRAAATYGRVNTGSMTAANMADDTHMEGLVGVAANAGVRAIKGHGLIGNAVATIGDLYRYGGGKAGDRLRMQLAAAVSETDPIAIRKTLRAAQRELDRVKSRDRISVGGTIGSLTTGNR